jgi:mevalonate kinase
MTPALFKFSIPSKAFVLGEYAVLGGAPALLATIPPRFELRSGPPFGSGPRQSAARAFRDLSPEAPVRKLLQVHENTSLLECSFVDPHNGSGGFGGSTAEFALAYAALNSESADVSSLWKEYCHIQPQASGADLAAQWSGGAVVANPISKTVKKVDVSHVLKNWFVFSAAHQSGRKVKTHEHLEVLKRADLSQLSKSGVLSNGIQAAASGDFAGFALAVNEYARLLRSMGFELPQTTEDRAVLSKISGVRAVKGTGAMQADAVLVFGDPTENFSVLQSRVLQIAESRNLRLVTSGWKEEAGVCRVE